MKNYKIWRSSQDGVVSAAVEDGKKLTPLLHIVKHSPTGFEYGYGGSGPSDLALSILVNYFGESKFWEKTTVEGFPTVASKELAASSSMKHYQEFKQDFIQNRNKNEWFTISEGEITDWLFQREFPGGAGSKTS